MPNNNLLSLIMDPEDKQIQSFTNASWVCNTLKPSIEKISRGEFPSYFTNPPKIFSEKKGIKNLCLQKKIRKMCCNQKFPRNLIFPTIFPKNPFTKKLVICYHQTPPPKRQLQVWLVVHPSRTTASVDPNPPPAPGSRWHRFIQRKMCLTCWKSSGIRTMFEGCFSGLQGLQILFQHLTSPFGFPRCFSVAKLWNSNGRSQWDEGCFSGIRTKNKLYTSENLKIAPRKRRNIYKQCLK